MSRRFYAVHRWLGLVVGVQLALWCVGGLIFATHDLAWVRGEDGRNPARAPGLDLGRVRLAPDAAVAALAAGAAGDGAAGDGVTGAGAAGGAGDAGGASASVDEIVLRPLLGRAVYEIRHGDGATLVDAESGAVLSPLGRDTAIAIARADRAGQPEVLGATLIERDPPTEYREGALPAWQIAFADGEGTHVYVAANTGRITARRNDAWRRFDFFWMLHTMDYRDRDDFNHPLLIAAAAAAVITLASGFALWGIRLRRRWRRAAGPARA
jgi:uncharacterized iron-regulated membrane protein